jgi:hypothetical protein
MTYKLKDHVTEDMLVAVGFKFGTHVGARWYSRGNVFIPIKRFINDDRIIQNVWRNKDLNVNEIKDLIELGYVEEMK